MTFEEFLKLIRKRVGSYCPDNYWKWKYEQMKICKKAMPEIERMLPLLAVNAIATHNGRAWV